MLLPASEIRDVAAAVVNFNTAALTGRCVRSLVDAGVPAIVVLDNGSEEEDHARLRLLLAASSGVRLIRSEANVGFAQGCNRLIEECIADRACARVLLLNSDAVVEPPGLESCLRAMRESDHDLMGGRMMKPPAGEGATVVDSLGIALYKCLLASNRMSTADAYLGPTGGFALYSRRFLEDVRRLHGYVFDPSYFCYAEDTDLCVRARLLGCSIGYEDRVVAYHEGQASNAGGVYDDFILYHGIRNSIWMVAKSIPFWTFAARLHWFLALHAGIVVRHTMQGRWRTLLRLYRDALLGLPAAISGRSSVQASRRVTLKAFSSHIDRHFYEPRFLEGALRDLFGRR